MFRRKREGSASKVKDVPKLHTTANFKAPNLLSKLRHRLSKVTRHKILPSPQKKKKKKKKTSQTEAFWQKKNS